MPLGAGHKLARFAGRQFAKRTESPMVQAVIANQQVIHDHQLTSDEARRLAEEVFISKAISLMDYFHYSAHPDALVSAFTLPDETKRTLAAMKEHALIAVAPHMSNFDLAGHLLAALGVTVQALSYPNPNANYDYHNQIRARHGLRPTPMSPQALREAKQTLKDGGSVVTGMDRPIEDAASQKYLVRFFGHPARLPVIHTRLALDADVPVAVLCCFQRPDLSYELRSSPVFALKHFDDKADDITINTEMMLEFAEKFIIEAPGQWHMFYPVWPDIKAVEE